jgi:hypothetical protein
VSVTVDVAVARIVTVTLGSIVAVRSDTLAAAVNFSCCAVQWWFRRRTGIDFPHEHFALGSDLGIVLFARLGLERPPRQCNVYCDCNDSRGHDDRHKRAAQNIFGSRVHCRGVITGGIRRDLDPGGGVVIGIVAIAVILDVLQSL